MRNSPLLVAMFLAALGALAACRCTPPGDETGEATPEVATEAPEATPEETTGASEAPIPVSPEVAALIEAGDVSALAADMQARTARMRELSASTEQRSKSLEEIAEGMTGRSTTIDPADPATVETLTQSADRIATGAQEMATDVAALRQLVVDLRAEADAIYGAPAGSDG